MSDRVHLRAEDVVRVVRVGVCAARLCRVSVPGEYYTLFMLHRELDLAGAVIDGLPAITLIRELCAPDGALVRTALGYRVNPLSFDEDLWAARVLLDYLKEET